MTLAASLSVLPGRCAHGYHVATMGCPDCSTEAKAAVLEAVNTAAEPDFAARIDAAIRSAAALGTPFSANSIRPALSDCPGPLIGARFNALAKAGVIEECGYVKSSKPNTNAHRILQWRGVQP